MSNATPAPLSLTVSVGTVTIDNGRHDIDVPGAHIVGPGVDCDVIFNADGEPSDIKGTYPANRHVQLMEIAGDASSYGDTAYEIDATGGWDVAAKAVA